MMMFLGNVFAGGARPVADAGPDQSVVLNAPVDLDGTGSFDADGETLRWIAGISVERQDGAATFWWLKREPKSLE